MTVYTTPPLTPFRSLPFPAQTTGRINTHAQRSGLDVSPNVLKAFVQDTEQFTARAVDEQKGLQGLNKREIKRGLKRATQNYLQHQAKHIQTPDADITLVPVRAGRIHPELSPSTMAYRSFLRFMNAMAQKEGKLEPTENERYKLDGARMIDLRLPKPGEFNKNSQRIQKQLVKFMDSVHGWKLSAQALATTPVEQEALLRRVKNEELSLMQGLEKLEPIQTRRRSRKDIIEQSRAQHAVTPETTKEEKMRKATQRADEASRIFFERGDQAFGNPRNNTRRRKSR
jgi:hypothetical protein